MAFPRAKANVYEYGIHVPLAMRWGRRVKGGRRVEQVVSLVDLAPTFLEAAGLKPEGTAENPYPMQGTSLLGTLSGGKSSSQEQAKVGAYSSRERHSSSRPNNWGYPQRALRTAGYLYIVNYKPDRWPAGDPQKLEPNKTTGKLEPGRPHGGYHDIDAGATFDLLLEKKEDPAISPFFRLAVDKRPAEELYDIRKDPGCLHNLAGRLQWAQTKADLSSRLDNYLKETQAPRATRRIPGSRQFVSFHLHPTGCSSKHGIGLAHQEPGKHNVSFGCFPVEVTAKTRQLFLNAPASFWPDMHLSR